MTLTAWGAQITYAFEIEGVIDYTSWLAFAPFTNPAGDYGILRWFRPDTISEPTWTHSSEFDKQAAMIKYMRENWPSKTKSYDNMVKLFDAPSWIRIEQEAWP